METDRQKEAERLFCRLMSSDPDFNDCTDAANFIREVAADLKGPNGFESWKDAAVDERVRRVQLEYELVEMRRAQPEANADAVKCWKDRMAKPEGREWRGAMEEAMEAEIMELRMILSSNKVDAERYRYIRDTATLDNAVWEALEGYGMTNGAGELLEDEYRAGMDRAIDRAIEAARQATPTTDAPQAKGSEVDCG